MKKPAMMLRLRLLEDHNLRLTQRLDRLQVIAHDHDQVMGGQRALIRKYERALLEHGVPLETLTLMGDE
jgi:hypothetical protein